MVPELICKLKLYPPEIIFPQFEGSLLLSLLVCLNLFWRPEYSIASPLIQSTRLPPNQHRLHLIIIVLDYFFSLLDRDL